MIFFLFYSPLFPVGENKLKESKGIPPVPHSFIG